MSGRSTKGNTSRCRLKIGVVFVYFTEFVGGCGFIVGLERGRTGRSRKHKGKAMGMSIIC